MRDKFQGASSGTPNSTLQPQSRTCTKALLASLGNRSWAWRNAPPCGHFPQQQPEIYCLGELGSVQSLSRIQLFATPHGLQHTRPPCPSPTPGACANSSPLSRWHHQAISSSVVPFSSCFQSFPASGSFLESVVRIRWPTYQSFSFSISPSNDYSGLISFRVDWLDLLADSEESSPTP